jgi:hypothetical protein
MCAAARASGTRATGAGSSACAAARACCGITGAWLPWPSGVRRALVGVLRCTRSKEHGPPVLGADVARCCAQ